ncbi:MAG TPA: UvrD-helicase domain-containing protein [Candidatus Humimicrobiaceae bacterium]|nr:UvrD-helicase domain-containing protein [Candidatus Humimicrobiaceae bacterium]
MLYSYCQNCGVKSTKCFLSKAGDFSKNCEKRTDGNISVCQQCKECLEGSKESIEKILLSKQKNKLILGGPGTGKTFLFGSVMRNLPKGNRVLVITFINNLVDDLEKQLIKISDRDIETRTLHGFSKNFLLSEIRQYEYFPELPKIIEQDAFLSGLSFKEKDFGRAFINLQKESKETKFYLHRSEYYFAVGHDDAVYRVFCHLNENKETIPQYFQVIVDEYQDFNLLESSLIELLAQRNNTIIAGDDDQALYRFKFASPDFIRKLYQDQQFEKFFLPFCRRCTSVLVEAANAFISNAKKKGLLNNRIEKEFKCYWPDKFLDSKKYPFISLGKFFADSVATKYIKEKIFSIIEEEKIEPSEKNEPEFLIIGPPRISHYLRDVNDSLINDKRLDRNIFEIEFKKESKRLSTDDGYKFIKGDAKSNLGWRIVMYKDPVSSSLEKDKEIIRESSNGKLLIDLLPEDYINKHREKANNISPEEIKDPDEIINKKIKIKLTTYLGAKGLSANHVFVLGLENGIFPKDPNNISDDEVCQLLVLLTRARKSLNLLSVNRFNKKIRRRIDSLSGFISMIPNQFLKIENTTKASDFKS